VREDLANNPALLDYIGLHMSPGATVEKGDSVEQLRLPSPPLAHGGQLRR
jgi:hypothetical protein